jgi:hypothetical protein
MVTAAKWALGIVPAGILLGALLGAAANPHMKDPPAPWWRLTGAETFTASSEPALDEWPQDFAAARSYRPDFDYDIEVWDLAIPADEVWVPADEPHTLPPERLAAGEVADEAEATAGDALAAATPEPAVTPEILSEAAAEPSKVRPPELAGLY